MLSTFHLSVEGDSADVSDFRDAVATDASYPEGSGPLIRDLREAHAECVDEGPTHGVWKFEGGLSVVAGVGEAALAVAQLKYTLSWVTSDAETSTGHVTFVGGDKVDSFTCESSPLGGLSISVPGRVDPVVLTDDSVADLRRLLAEPVPV